MKTPLTYFLVLQMVFSSCNQETEIVLTENLVEELHAYDLDNNGNASDIRVDFVVKDNLNVLEYRVMVVPEDQKDSFDESMADKVPRESYWEVYPEGFQFEYTVDRLPEDLLDINGNLISNDNDYRVFILTVGEDDKM